MRRGREFYNVIEVVSCIQASKRASFSFSRGIMELSRVEYSSAYEWMVIRKKGAGSDGW